MTSTRIATPTQLRDAYRNVNDRIAVAAGRSGRRPGNIVMVAVTKNASPDQIRTLVEMGHSDLGENRVQQLCQRTAQIEEFISRRRTLAGAVTKEHGETPRQVRWHMVGHLQRNKVKTVVPLVKLIHSVDSLRLAEEIQSYAAHRDVIADVLIQANISREVTKAGIAAPAVVHLAEQIDTMSHLRVRGMMTMAPYSTNPEDARQVFALAAEIFSDLGKAKLADGECNILSMGMSNDFEVAIEEGANVVRIGRALFGDVDSG